ncbi:MAG: hypothetical protein Q9203_006293 [Teloschistes exilis]
MLTNPAVACTPNTTDESLSTFSCGNAWHKIVRTTPPVIYSPRPGTGKAGDVSLPVRYLSDDGLCAIDINVAQGKRGDVSNGLSIARAADEIIRTCVPRQSMSGEKVGFSIQGGLTVKVVIYSTERVTCHTPTSALLQPIPAACQQLLQEMPADDHYPVVFSRDGRTGNVKLPWMKNAEPCRIVIDLFHPAMYKKIKANWYDVWAAGVAVNELCVKRSLIGVVGPIGWELEAVTVELVDSVRFFGVFILEKPE